MNVSAIKKMNEIIPYWIKRPVSEAIRSKLIGNRRFLDQYLLLCEADQWSKERKQQFQQHELYRMLKYANDHSMYYQKLFENNNIELNGKNDQERLARIPALSKKTLQTHLEEISVNGLKDFYTVTTGGTTGQPTTVYMEKDAIYREWAFVYHFWSKFGYDYKTSKLVTLRGVDLGNKVFEINPLYREVRLNTFRMNKENISDYVKAADAYGADFIYGYPSSVYNFFRLCELNDISVKGKYKAALLISENLYSFQEELIKRVGGCPVAIFYGHSERAVFAERYEYGYVLNPLYGYTEFNDKGNPIVTGFINRKTPLIKYEVDDEFIPKNNGFYDIVGHRDCEVLYGVNGEQISMAAVNVHDDTFENIESYQFYQDTPGKCALYVTCSTELPDSRIIKIENSVNHKLAGAVNCTVKQTDKILYTERGKYKMVIQKLSGGVS